MRIAQRCANQHADEHPDRFEPVGGSPAAAQLVVLKAGVSTDSMGTAGYGIVLNNPTGSDAVHVELQINLNRGSSILPTDTPASGTRRHTVW